MENIYMLEMENAEKMDNVSMESMNNMDLYLVEEN